MTAKQAIGFSLLLMLMLAVLLGACDNGGNDSDDDSNSPADDDLAADDDDAPGDDDTADDDTSGDDDTADDDSAFTCDIDHADSTVGLLSCHDGAFEGYTLLEPGMTTTMYLVDIYGRIVNTWKSSFLPGQVAYLLENGQLLRTGNTLNLNFRSGGQGGIVMLQNWDGTVTWRYRYSTDSYCSHHDVEMLPNGNLLLIAWEKKTAAEAIAAGRNPASLRDELWPDKIVEVEPVGSNDGNIVWEWHAWDHLIQDYDGSKDNYGTVADHPELIDINYYSGTQQDWLHTNAVEYNEEFDQILLSVREFNEVWVIDHGTTTEEAAGRLGGARGQGGDILYRWGNPAAYGYASAGRFFYLQHDGQWIEPGLPGASHMMVFNNGVGRPGGNYSTVDEWIPPSDAAGNYPFPNPVYGPDDLFWTYVAPNPTDLFSSSMSGAQRLANGNTLICSAVSGHLTEVTAEDETVWEYINPVTEAGIAQQGQPIVPGVMGNGNMMFRSYRYAPDFPGFAGMDLTPGDCLVEPCE